MKFNCTTRIVDLNENPILSNGQITDVPAGEPLTVGAVLATIISREKTAYSEMKAWALAKRLHREPSMELDDGDISDLRDAVEKSERWAPFVRAQLKQALIALSDKPKKESQ